MKHLNAFILFICIANITYAQQLNIPKGKKFYYQTSNNDKLMKDDQQYTYSFLSKGKNAEGNTVLECTLVKAHLRDKGITYLNTDSIQKTNFRSTAIFFPLAILNRPFTVILNPKGKVVKVDGVQQSLQNALDKWKLSPDISQNIINNVKVTFDNTVQQMFFQFPEKDIQKSPEWENKDSGFKFKLNTNTAKSRVISSTKKGDKDMLHKNKYALDPATGMIQNSAEQYTYTSTSISSAGDTTSRKAEILNTQKLINSFTVAKADPKWAEMAILFSSWTDELKSGGSYDSVKVFNAFKSHDAAFNNNAYYRSHKLSLIQQVGRNNYKLYDSLLLQTPNEFIADGSQVHLHNKLSSALSRQSPDAAYQVTKYLINTPSFSQWIQQSFSQSFLSRGNDEGAVKRSADAYSLLNLFMKDKNVLYQQKVKPLYLWANAKKNPSDLPGLLKSADELGSMNDELSKAGNASRYALLIYKMLLQNKQQAVADSLLSKTLKKLEKYSADTGNENHFADQNILAYAWHLKYEATAKKDSVQAIQYLAKAAQYAPKDNREKAYASFYDRVFLESKESYRQEYIDKLLSSGNEKQALNLIAIDINANPENLPEMQKIYKNRFPGKDFKSFFIQDVMASWNAAPDFKLKNIDGKEHSLADYKNKWLILDFWGTWCGPCKEELPSVNKFYTELASGKHGDNNFLSIACYDKEDKVKSFIAQNKYSIPVAMSDDKVERDYKITGYPSKILISPEGKMINIQFGKDWKSILKQLNNIYSMN